MHFCCPELRTAGKILYIWANSCQHDCRAQISNIKKNKVFFMKFAVILVVALGLVLCALSAGCTSPTQVEIKPLETTVPTPPPATSTSASSSTATVISTPVAVETLPSGQNVDIQVEKQRPDATIHLLYNGGEGEMFVQNIMMRVTRSDGQVEEHYLNDGARKPRRGDELVIAGTRGSDQVVVFLTSSGKTYRIFDKPLVLPYY
jgi:hypothetical protein